MVAANNKLAYRLAVGSGLLLCAATAPAQQFLTDGKAGFVLADIKFVLGPDGKGTKACPKGMTIGPGEIWERSSEGKRRPGESDKDYSERKRVGVYGGVSREAYAASPKNACLHPETQERDPHFRVVEGSNFSIEGLDLDGKVSDNDFQGVKGEKGIDNQFWRLVGCSPSYQSTGPENTFGVTIGVGEWGAVFTLGGVDDLKNDADVKVGIYDTKDPVQLSPTRQVLEYATYAMNQDQRFRAETKGRIKDGVLTTDPIDVRWRYVINNLRLEREIKGAVLHATISDGGTMEGYLAGWSPIDNIYDFQYGFRSGKDGTGQLADARARSGTAGGKAFTMPHTCPGAWYALHDLADGHPDPKTGKFTTISTQYKIKAVPAFVVDENTSSANEDLDKAGYKRGNN